MLEEWDYRENEATLEPHIWEFRERPPKQYLILREKLKKKEEEKQREIDEKWEARNKRKEKERQEKEEKERREKEAGDKQRDDPNAGPSLLSGSDGNTGGNSSNVNNNNNSDNKDEDEKQEGDASPKMDYLVQEYEKDMRERTVERYEKPACVIC